MSGREAIQKVRSVRLVPPDDPDYVAAMAEQALAHRRYGPREEQTATYHVSGRIEQAARDWLSLRVPLLRERIVAADVLFRDARGYVPLFVELDAVEGRDGIPVRVYEVKFTSNLSAVQRGFAQLGRALRLLGSRYERVDAAVVLVQADRGPLASDDPRLADAVEIGPDDLARAALPARAFLRLDVAELAPFLGADDLGLLLAARDESDANVSARLERTAAIERGETPPSRERQVRPGATLAFEDEPEPGGDELADSPFAALRALRVPRQAGDAASDE